jgi:integrase
LSDWAVWSVVEQVIEANRDRTFRRTRSSSDLRQTLPEERGDLEQIKFLLGHSFIQTTERYLGSDQEIVVAVNDNLGL